MVGFQGFGDAGITRPPMRGDLSNIFTNNKLITIRPVVPSDPRDLVCPFLTPFFNVHVSHLKTWPCQKCKWKMAWAPCWVVYRPEHSSHLITFQPVLKTRPVARSSLSVLDFKSSRDSESFLSLTVTVNIEKARWVKCIGWWPSISNHLRLSYSWTLNKDNFTTKRNRRHRHPAINYAKVPAGIKINRFGRSESGEMSAAAEL